MKKNPKPKTTQAPQHTHTKPQQNHNSFIYFLSFFLLKISSTGNPFLLTNESLLEEGITTAFVVPCKALLTREMRDLEDFSDTD